MDILETKELRLSSPSSALRIATVAVVEGRGRGGLQLFLIGHDGLALLQNKVRRGVNGASRRGRRRSVERWRWGRRRRIAFGRRRGAGEVSEEPTEPLGHLFCGGRQGRGGGRKRSIDGCRVGLSLCFVGLALVIHVAVHVLPLSSACWCLLRLTTAPRRVGAAPSGENALGGAALTLALLLFI